MTKQTMEQRHLVDALTRLLEASRAVYGCMRHDGGVWYMDRCSGTDPGAAIEQLGLAIFNTQGILNTIPATNRRVLSCVAPKQEPSIWEKLQYAISVAIEEAMSNNDSHTYQALKSFQLHVTRCEQQSKGASPS